MAIFGVLRNQSQYFITIFRNFKNQSQRSMYYDYIWCFLLKAVYIKIKTLGYSGLRSSALASKTETITE